VDAASDHPFLYSNGQMEDLGFVGEGYAINNIGQVTGDLKLGLPSGALHCFLYSNGQTQDLGTLGGPHSFGYGINDSGQVVGYSYLPSGYRHAFLYSSGEMRDLGTLGGNESFGNGINSAGQVVGSATKTDDGLGHAFLYSNGIMQDLGSLGGQNAGALAINDVGQVVGTAQSLLGLNHAFLYTNGRMQDLGTLGGNYGYAQAINNAGLIVGSASTPTDALHAMLYQNGQMQDLNDYIDPNSGWTLISANGINDLGQIVGYGYYQGQQWAFLLTPTPLTVTTASLAGGVVGSVYSQTLAAGGGTPPYIWMISGGRLPIGLTLNSATGEITGTPTNPVSSFVTFKVTDSGLPAQTATMSLTLTILTNTFTITTASLPNGQVGVPYSHPLATIGGVQPFKWELAGGSAPPAGLTLNASTGAISGTPGVAVVNYRLLVRVTDSTTPTAQTASTSLTITVLP
jgi:probable HAF family extracellular repeat protein